MRALGDASLRACCASAAGVAESGSAQYADAARDAERLGVVVIVGDAIGDAGSSASGATDASAAVVVAASPQA
jgi:hypothetical protein